MLSTLRRTLFALLACASFIVHAAAPDEITTAWPVNVGPLNPHLYTPNQMFAQSMVYEPLVKYQADGSVIPWLAKSWTHSEDGKTWTFTLRDDVKFSNGEPFDAEAAAENFRAVLDNRQRHAWLELANQIVDVKALSKTELQITLKSAYYPFLQELALPRPFRFIAPSQFKNHETMNGIKAPIGTGPWILQESKLNQYDVFVRNENYWGEKPAIKRSPLTSSRTRLPARWRLKLAISTCCTETKGYYRSIPSPALARIRLTTPNCHSRSKP